MIAVLRVAYPRAEFPEDTQRAYVRLLADVDSEALDAAARRLVNRSTFLPSVAELRREIAEAELRLPDASVAWEIANRGSLRDAPAEVRAAAESVGGRWSILHAERPETVRAQFIRDYTERRERSIQEAMKAAPPRVTSLPARRVMELPESTRLKPRPVVARAVKRLAGMKLEPPSDEEKRDAIVVLAEGSLDAELRDSIYREAELIFEEAAS